MWLASSTFPSTVKSFLIRGHANPQARQARRRTPRLYTAAHLPAGISRVCIHKPRGAVAQVSGSTFIYVSGVSICDVGPRDGLQNEARTLEPSVRASLCDRLANAGLKKMEAASFVNPKLVPQMGGAEEVMSALHRKPGVVYAGLVLNEKGYDRARAAGVDEIHYAFSATDEFGRRNQNATAAEGLKTALLLVRRAR